MRNLSKNLSPAEKLLGKTLVILLVLFIALFIIYPMLALGYARYQTSMKPFKFLNSKWTCEEQNMWFFTTETNADGCRGTFMVNGEMQELYFKPLAGDRGAICTIDSPARLREDYLWSGDVKYRKNQFTLLSMDEGMTDVLFEEDDYPIVFIREALSTEEVEGLKEQFSH